MVDFLEKLIAHYQKALVIQPDNTAIRNALERLYEEQKHLGNVDLLTKPHNTPEAVEQYYEEWTDRYIEGFGRVFQALLTENVEDLILYIAHTIGIKDGMRVLDAGCGICGPAIMLAERFDINVEAVTVSETQMKYALENIQKSDLKGTVNVRKADFHQLEKYYQDEEFDAIFFLESLTHSHDPRKVIQSAHSVLRNEGTIYIKDLYRGPDNPSVKGQIDYPIEAIENQFCLKIRSVGEIIDTLSECGFELAFCRRPQVEANFDGGNNFTAKHLFKLLKDQNGPWVDRGMVFLNWLEIKAVKHY